MMKAYWKDRLEEAQKVLTEKSAKDMEEGLATLYRKAIKDTKKDIELLYLQILENPDRGMIDYYRYERFYLLANNLNERLQRLGQKEDKILEQHLYQLYEKAQKAVGKHAPIPFATVSEERAKMVVKEIWCIDNKSYSERI